jgi:two-component system NarL family sensor kinase
VAAAAGRSRDPAGPESELLRQVAARLRQSVRDLRGLLVEIYPPDLHRAGLGAALSDVVGGLETRGLKPVLSLPEDLDLPPEVETLFFRVAQEALRNVVAHAAANRVEVRVLQPDGNTVLEIEDDGRGFSVDLTGLATGHFGLRMLSDLARDAGARLDIESSPGRGTIVRVEVTR